jgi:hypothetical protein
MSEQPRGTPPTRTRVRSPRISLPVAIIGFAAAAGVALVLIALILRPDPERQTADPGGTPSPSLTASQVAIVSPSVEPASPSTAPTPSAIPATPRPSHGPAGYPVKGQADPDLMVAGPDGGVYAAVRDGRSTVVGLFAPGGIVQPGWPVHVAATYCISIHAAPDGSVRLACSPPEDGSEGLGPPVMRIFAIDRQGHPMRGWPVDIENGAVAGMQGDAVAVTVSAYFGEGGEDGDTEPIGLAEIRADGQVRMGRGGPEDTCCDDNTTAIGPASAYLVNRTGDLVDTASSELIAFGLEGVQWRASIDGTASDPAFDAEGNAYLSAWMPGRSTSRMFVFGPDGHRLPFNADTLAMRPTNGSAPAGPEHPVAPSVSSDGSSFVVEEANDATILALDAAGTHKRGWPVSWASGLEHAGDCGQDTGCGLPTVMPAIGQDGTLYVALNTTSETAGGSLTALSPAGKVRAGWPVGLKLRGAQFWKVVAASDGGIWTLAAEPDKDGYDATLLSVAPDSTIRGKVTLVEAAPIGP